MEPKSSYRSIFQRSMKHFREYKINWRAYIHFNKHLYDKALPLPHSGVKIR